MKKVSLCPKGSIHLYQFTLSESGTWYDLANLSRKTKEILDYSMPQMPTYSSIRTNGKITFFLEGLKVPEEGQDYNSYMNIICPNGIENGKIGGYFDLSINQNTRFPRAKTWLGYSPIDGASVTHLMGEELYRFKIGGFGKYEKPVDDIAMELLNRVKENSRILTEILPASPLKIELCVV